MATGNGTVINRQRCLQAMKRIEIAGEPRPGLIEIAIAAIQNDGTAAMSKQFFGIKNYAAFGDQREDCIYGCGPRHGDIVFRIGRTRGGGVDVLGADEIYLLECVRDFGVWEDSEYHKGEYSPKRKRRNLIDVLRLWDKARCRMYELDCVLAEHTVHTEGAADGND